MQYRSSWHFETFETWNVFPLFFQHLHCDFLEIHDVFVTVVLQPDVALVRTSAALWLKAEFAFGDRIAFGVLRYFGPVQDHDRAWPVQGDLHRVPLRSRLSGAGERL